VHHHRHRGEDRRRSGNHRRHRDHQSGHRRHRDHRNGHRHHRRGRSDEADRHRGEEEWACRRDYGAGREEEEWACRQEHEGAPEGHPWLALQQQPLRPPAQRGLGRLRLSSPKVLVAAARPARPQGPEPPLLQEQARPSVPVWARGQAQPLLQEQVRLSPPGREPEPQPVVAPLWALVPRPGRPPRAGWPVGAAGWPAWLRPTTRRACHRYSSTAPNQTPQRYWRTSLPARWPQLSWAAASCSTPPAWPRPELRPLSRRHHRRRPCRLGLRVRPCAGCGPPGLLRCSTNGS
jgi:hypothetical protein